MKSEILNKIKNYNNYYTKKNIKLINIYIERNNIKERICKLKKIKNYVIIIPNEKTIIDISIFLNSYYIV